MSKVPAVSMKLKPKVAQKFNVFATQTRIRPTKTEKLQKLLDSADQLAEEEKWQQAIFVWDEALKVREKPEIYELKAQAFLAMGQHFMAIKFATLATDQLPDWPPAYLTLARAQFEFGELELSRQSYERYFQLNPAAKDEVSDEIARLLHSLQKKAEIQAQLPEEEIGRVRMVPLGKDK